MEKLLLSFKNVFKELFLVIFVLLILIAFFAPVITEWGGLYSDTTKSEMGAIIIKTSMASNKYKADGEFVWNNEEKEVVYAN